MTELQEEKIKAEIAKLKQEKTALSKKDFRTDIIFWGLMFYLPSVITTMQIEKNVILELIKWIK